MPGTGAQGRLIVGAEQEIEEAPLRRRAPRPHFVVRRREVAPARGEPPPPRVHGLSLRTQLPVLTTGVHEHVFPAVVPFYKCGCLLINHDDVTV